MNNDECTKTYTQIHTESKMEIMLNQFQELSKIDRFDITLETKFCCYGYSVVQNFACLDICFILYRLLHFVSFIAVISRPHRLHALPRSAEMRPIART